MSMARRVGVWGFLLILPRREENECRQHTHKGQSTLPQTVESFNTREGIISQGSKIDGDKKMCHRDCLSRMKDDPSGLSSVKVRKMTLLASRIRASCAIQEVVWEYSLPYAGVSCPDNLPPTPQRNVRLSIYPHNACGQQAGIRGRIEHPHWEPPGYFLRPREKAKEMGTSLILRRTLRVCGEPHTLLPFPAEVCPVSVPLSWCINEAQTWGVDRLYVV